MPQFERRLYEPSDDPRAFDSDEDMEDEGSRLPLLIGIALIVLLSFGGVVWLAYTQGVERGRADTPRVVASADVASADRKPTPYSKLKIYQPPKTDEDVASEDPAPPPAAVTPPDLSTTKAPVPKTNSEAKSSALKTATHEPKADSSPTKTNVPEPVVQPATGAPRVITPTPATAKTAKPAVAPVRTPAAKPAITPASPKPNALKTVPQTKTAVVKSAAQSISTTPKAVPAKATPAKTPATKTAALISPPPKPASGASSEAKPATKLAAVAPMTTAPATTAAVTPKEAPAKTGAAGFLLQIGSYKSDAEANASWQTYKGAHSSVASYSSDVHKVELGAKGTWYRLRIGPFASLSEANAACAKLKAQGGNCFPAKQ